MAIEIFDGTTWTKLVNSNDLQSALILPVMVISEDEAESQTLAIDGVNIPIRGLVLFVNQNEDQKNGIYIRNADHSFSKIMPQPLGAYITQGKRMVNTLFFNQNDIWVQFGKSKTSLKKKKNKS